MLDAAVPDDLADEISLSGPKEHMREHMKEWKKSPVTSLNPDARDPELLRFFAEEVVLPNSGTGHQRFDGTQDRSVRSVCDRCALMGLSHLGCSPKKAIFAALLPSAPRRCTFEKPPFSRLISQVSTEPA